jgi:hypothetical protein
MAATAAYVSIARIPPGSVPTDGKTFSNISTTTAAFGLGEESMASPVRRAPMAP